MVEFFNQVKPLLGEGHVLHIQPTVVVIQEEQSLWVRLRYLKLRWVNVHGHILCGDRGHTTKEEKNQDPFSSYDLHDL